MPRSTPGVSSPPSLSTSRPLPSVPTLRGSLSPRWAGAPRCSLRGCVRTGRCFRQNGSVHHRSPCRAVGGVDVAAVPLQEARQMLSAYERGRASHSAPETWSVPQSKLPAHLAAGRTSSGWASQWAPKCCAPGHRTEGQSQGVGCRRQRRHPQRGAARGRGMGAALAFAGVLVMGRGEDMAPQVRPNSTGPTRRGCAELWEGE